MNLYEVIYWGTKEKRNDDADTIYLVRAPDFQAAIHFLTDFNGLDTPDRVHEIGVDLSPFADKSGTMILRGPYFQCAFTYGWKSWKRKIEGAGCSNEWEEDPNNADLGEKKS